LRILAVADFHGTSSSEINLSKFLRRGYDCVILIGDLTNFGPPEVAEGIIELVKNSGIPSFSIPGNCDPKAVLQVLEKYGTSIHGKCARLGDVSFVGLGGSNLTPFNTPFELTENEIQEELAAASCEMDEKWVLVTHAPPYETKLDRITAGTHVGSKSIRNYIEKKQPLVSLCGHVHEGRGFDQLGRTTIINPGSVAKGYGAEVVIVANGKVDFRLLGL
jgi:Icc-related predicted phosphoesterase